MYTIKKSFLFRPLFVGTQQEKLRGGTVNITGILQTEEALKKFTEHFNWNDALLLKNRLIDMFTSIFLKEIQVGSSRSEALRQLSWRVNTISVASFTSTLIAADSVGASIGGILKELSKELRQRRSTIAEKKGSQASTKMMFPMMMFILPAIFLIIAAPFMIGLFVK